MPASDIFSLSLTLPHPPPLSPGLRAWPPSSITHTFPHCFYSCSLSLDPPPSARAPAPRAAAVTQVLSLMYVPRRPALPCPLLTSICWLKRIAEAVICEPGEGAKGGRVSHGAWQRRPFQHGNITGSRWSEGMKAKRERVKGCGN